MEHQYLYPPLQRSWKGVYWFTLSVRLSVCGQNRVRSVSSTILVGFMYYLHILSSNFRRCITCKVCFKIHKFWQILYICIFDFLFFWLGIQYDSILWVIMRRRGVSSEHRHYLFWHFPDFPWKKTFKILDWFFFISKSFYKYLQMLIDTHTSYDKIRHSFRTKHVSMHLI